MILLRCVLFALLLGMGCASHAALPAVDPPPDYGHPPGVLFHDTLPDDFKVCVPGTEYGPPTMSCLTLGELRHLLRGRRIV